VYLLNFIRDIQLFRRFIKVIQSKVMYLKRVFIQ